MLTWFFILASLSAEASQLRTDALRLAWSCGELQQQQSTAQLLKIPVPRLTPQCEKIGKELGMFDLAPLH
jgi:hypothetical protein